MANRSPSLIVNKSLIFGIPRHEYRDRIHSTRLSFFAGVFMLAGRGLTQRTNFGAKTNFGANVDCQKHGSHSKFKTSPFHWLPETYEYCTILPWSWRLCHHTLFVWLFEIVIAMVQDWQDPPVVWITGFGPWENSHNRWAFLEALWLISGTWAPWFLLQPWSTESTESTGGGQPHRLHPASTEESAPWPQWLPTSVWICLVEWVAWVKRQKRISTHSRNGGCLVLSSRNHN